MNLLWWLHPGINETRRMRTARMASNGADRAADDDDGRAADHRRFAPDRQ